MSPRGATFELERFSVSPVSAEVAVLEVEGRLSGAPARARAPRLLVERADGARREHAPIEASARDEQLTVSFAVPTGDAQAGLALAVGGLLLGLPAPDPASGSDRTIALSREVNGLRRELATLREEVAASREAAAEHEAELERRDQEAAERQRAVEQDASDRIAAAEQELALHAAAADQVAVDRVAEAERTAAERQAEFARATAKRQGDLERAVTGLEEQLAQERAAARQRDAEMAAAHADVQRELEASRKESGALRRALDQELRVAALAQGERTRAAATPLAAPVEPVDPEATTVGRPAESQPPPPPRDPEERTTVSRPADDDTAEGPFADETDERPIDDTEERPADDDTAERGADDEDTGPTPLRRGSVRRGPDGLRASVEGTRGETVRVMGRERRRDDALAPRSDAEVAHGLSTRTLALAALGLALLLVVVAVLGVAL